MRRFRGACSDCAAHSRRPDPPPFKEGADSRDGAVVGGLGHARLAPRRVRIERQVQEGRRPTYGVNSLTERSQTRLQPPASGHRKTSLSRVLTKVARPAPGRSSRGLSHHPPDCGWGQGRRRGGDGGIGDVVGVMEMAVERAGGRTGWERWISSESWQITPSARIGIRSALTRNPAGYAQSDAKSRPRPPAAPRSTGWSERWDRLRERSGRPAGKRGRRRPATCPWFERAVEGRIAGRRAEIRGLR